VHSGKRRAKVGPSCRTAKSVRLQQEDPTPMAPVPMWVCGQVRLQLPHGEEFAVAARHLLHHISDSLDIYALGRQLIFHALNHLRSGSLLAGSHAIRMQSECNQNTTRMQSEYNQNAIRMQSEVGRACGRRVRAIRGRACKQRSGAQAEVGRATRGRVCMQSDAACSSSRSVSSVPYRSRNSSCTRSPIFFGPAKLGN
jgi:hypothetical protein